MHRCRKNISSQLYDMEGHTEPNYSVYLYRLKEKKLYRYVGNEHIL